MSGKVLGLERNRRTRAQNLCLSQNNLIILLCQLIYAFDGSEFCRARMEALLTCKFLIFDKSKWEISNGRK